MIWEDRAAVMFLVSCSVNHEVQTFTLCLLLALNTYSAVNEYVEYLLDGRKGNERKPSFSQCHEKLKALILQVSYRSDTTFINFIVLLYS